MAREAAGLTCHVIATGAAWSSTTPTGRRWRSRGAGAAGGDAGDHLGTGQERNAPPPVAVEDPQARIRELLAARREAYGKIALRIATDGKTVGAIAGEILRLVSVK